MPSNPGFLKHRSPFPLSKLAPRRSRRLLRLSPDLTPRLVCKAPIDPDAFVASSWGGYRTAAAYSRFACFAGGFLAIAGAVGACYLALDSPSEVARHQIQSFGGSESIAVVEQMRKTLTGFLECESAEEQLAFVRRPEFVQMKMTHPVSNLSRFDLPSSTLRSLSNTFQEVSANGKDFGWAHVSFEDGTARTALFELTAEGPKLDWDSFVFYEPLSWDAFLTRRPVGNYTFRVEVSPSDYFNFGYKDESRLLCFKLVNPSGGETCWGYVDREAPTAARILRLCRPNRKTGNPQSQSAKLMLKLQFEQMVQVARTSAHQVRIESIVSDSWANLDGRD